MRDIPVSLRVDDPSGRLRPLADVLRAHATMQDVLDFCRAQQPPRDLAGLVVQDEFTHDVILPLDEGLFAVYDTT